MTILTCASTNALISLGKQIATSGEGEVWETSLSGYLAKLYHSPSPERVKKLEVMVANPPIDPTASLGHISIAWPKDLLKDHNGACVGFLMPAILHSSELPGVYNPKLRQKKAPKFNWLYLHTAAQNVASIIQAIHAKGYVLGDIKPQNLLVNERALVAVIDTDSFQVCDPHTGKVYPCTVGSEGFTPVELLGKNFSTVIQTEVHDRFRLAVIIHLLLFGNHPFQGKWTGTGESPEVDELIRRGFWPYSQASLIHPGLTTIPLYVVHPEIKQCFLRCFNDGYIKPDLRPTATDWFNALQLAISDLKFCTQEPNHCYSQTYSRCYWCERFHNLGVDIFATAPRIITTPASPSSGSPPITPRPTPPVIPQVLILLRGTLITVTKVFLLVATRNYGSSYHLWILLAYVLFGAWDLLDFNQEISHRPSQPTQQPLASTPSPQDQLISAVRIDYTQLRNLLAAGKWHEADEETQIVILKASGQERRIYDALYKDSIQKISCQDLSTIDQLWVKYSKGQFGFSIQNRIWYSMVGTPTASEIYMEFRDRVGWDGNGRWRTPIVSSRSRNSDWSTTIQNDWILEAPQGYLPSPIKSLGEYVGTTFLSRAKSCGL